MSREILEAMYALAREKGIEPEKLMIALEDALLSAYKKQPGSAKYARVEMDRYVSVAADFIRQRPVVCIAGAVTIGYLIGKLASRR